MTVLAQILTELRFFSINRTYIDTMYRHSDDDDTVPNVKAGSPIFILFNLSIEIKHFSIVECRVVSVSNISSITIEQHK